MKTKNKLFWVFDNNGETFDRFTIVLSNGDILGASEHPFQAQGFGQHCGNWIDSYFSQTFGYSWQKQLKLSNYKKRQVLNDQLSQWRQKGETEITDINNIPVDVLKFIQQNQ